MRITVRSENNPQLGTLSAMAYDKAAAVKALARFQRDTGLRDRPWETESGVGEGTLRKFRDGPNRSMSNETYEKLAAGATRKLGRPVLAAEIRGEADVPVQVPLRSYVGAGDEVIVLPTDDPPIDWVQAPTGMRDAEATEVRGRSMVPAYHDRDVLFHRRLEVDPLRYRDEIVVVQVKNGRRYVKVVLPGTRKGRFHLVSINPAYAPIEDQVLEWVGPIEWFHRRPRRR
jgi:phage repressor protein C with HTH and peptisase S24 domain